MEKDTIGSGFKRCVFLRALSLMNDISDRHYLFVSAVRDKTPRFPHNTERIRVQNSFSDVETKLYLIGYTPLATPAFQS